MSNKICVFVPNIPVFVSCGGIAVGLVVSTERGIKAAATPEWQSFSEEMDVHLVGTLGAGRQRLPCVEQDDCDALCYGVEFLPLVSADCRRLLTRNPMRPVAKLLARVI